MKDALDELLPADDQQVGLSSVIRRARELELSARMTQSVPAGGSRLNGELGALRHHAEQAVTRSRAAEW